MTRKIFESVRLDIVSVQMEISNLGNKTWIFQITKPPFLPHKIWRFGPQNSRVFFCNTHWNENYQNCDSSDIVGNLSNTTCCGYLGNWVRFGCFFFNLWPARCGGLKLFDSHGIELRWIPPADFEPQFRCIRSWIICSPGKICEIWQWVKTLYPWWTSK
jgi:hypothetical protein